MHTLRSVAISLSAICLTACAPALKEQAGIARTPGRIISEAMIADYAVSNAWEVLRKTGHYLASRDDGPSAGAGLRSKRGRTSINLGGSDVPRVIVDGNTMTDLRELKSIPAASIAWIQLLGAIEGTTYEGTNSGAGVIIIVTKAGS